MMLVCISKHRAAVFYFKMHHFFFFFHLNTFNSNIVCSYKGFRPQIYALLVTTLLLSAINSIQKKKTKNHKISCALTAQ